MRRLPCTVTENLSVAAAFDLSYADLTGDQQSPLPYPLVAEEIDRRVRALEAPREKLRAHRALQQRPDDLVTLDTNVLMHYHRLDEIPWAEVIGSGQVRIILLICVIDELDNKKVHRLGSDELPRCRAPRLTEPGLQARSPAASALTCGAAHFKTGRGTSAAAL